MTNLETSKTDTLEVNYTVIEPDIATQNTDPLLSLDDAQEVSGISKFTIRSWCQKNKIISQKINGRYGLEIRVKKSILLAYVKQNAQHDSVIIPEIKSNNFDSKPNLDSTQTKSNSERNQVEQTPSNINPDYLNIVKQQLSSIEKQLSVKDEQLSAKDQQIARLMDELKDSRTQSNTILKGINDNMIPLLETNQKMLDFQQNTNKEVQKMSDLREEIKQDVIETMKELIPVSPEPIIELKQEAEPKRKKFLGIF